MAHTLDQLCQAQTHLGRIAQWYFDEHPSAREARTRADLLECWSEIAGKLADALPPEEGIE